IYVDTLSYGLRLYFPWLSCGYWSPIPNSLPPGMIFYAEALATCFAIHKVSDLRYTGRHIKRLGMFLDNINTISIFNSLHAQPSYNNILKSAVNVHLNLNLDVQVQYISGMKNEVINVLSR
ncbi:hypothetical protein OBBRIDRAFT_726814, partial [Obba rivulosa]